MVLLSELTSSESFRNLSQADQSKVLDYATKPKQTQGGMSWGDFESSPEFKGLPFQDQNKVRKYYGMPELDERESQLSGEALENYREMGDIQRGLRRGLQESQSLGYGALGLIGDIFGSDRLRDWGFEGYQRNVEEAAQYPASVEKIEDIDWEIGKGVDWLQGAVAGQVPNIITMALGGGLIGAGAKAALKKASAKAIEAKVKKGVSRELAEQQVAKRITDASIVATAGGMEGGGMWGEEAQKGGVENVNTVSTALAGLAAGALEPLGVGGTISKMLSGLGRAKLKKLGIEGLKGMAGEGTTEGVQEAIAILNSKIHDPSVSFADKESISQILNSAVTGAVVGGGTSVVSGVLTPSETVSIEEVATKIETARDEDGFLSVKNVVEGDQIRKEAAARQPEDIIEAEFEDVVPTAQPDSVEDGLSYATTEDIFDVQREEELAEFQLDEGAEQVITQDVIQEEAISPQQAPRIAPDQLAVAQDTYQDLAQGMLEGKYRATDEEISNLRGVTEEQKEELLEINKDPVVNFQNQVFDVLNDEGQTRAITSIVKARANSIGMNPSDYLRERGVRVVPGSEEILTEADRQVNKGAVDLSQEGKATIHAFKSADVSTMVHELGHIFRRDLSGNEFQAATDWATDNGTWDTKAEEKFARGWENYITTGKAPNAELKSVFEKLKDWMLGIYKAVTHPDIDVEITPEIRSVFDSLVSSPGQQAEPVQQSGEGVLMQMANGFNGESAMQKDERSSALDESGFYSRYKENEIGSKAGQRSLKELETPYSDMEVPKTEAEKNFKKWFGDSLAVDEDGKPMVWYHGSPTFGKKDDPESWTFDPSRRGENVGHTFTGLGTTFTSNFNEAAVSARGKGDPLAFHIRVENPYILTKADIANLSKYTKGDDITAKTNAFMRRKIDLGDYDSIYNPETGFIYLDKSNQSKSLENTGLYGETGDVLLQQAPNAKYEEMRNITPSVKNRVWRGAKAKAREFTKGIDKYMGSISTRLGKIDQRISDDIRKLDFNIGTKSAEDVKEVLKMLDKVNDKKAGMSREDLKDWDYARKNSDQKVIDNLVDKYGLQEEYKDYRAKIDEIYKEAERVGFDVGYIENYSPRILKDKEGFLEHIGKGREWGRISQAIRQRADKLGIDITEMDKGMKADIASDVMFGGGVGVGSPGNVKERKIKEIPPELNQYYMDSDSALIAYLNGMRQAIEQRKFFGKVPKKITEAKRNMRRLQTTLRKGGLSDQREKDIKDDIKSYQKIINKFSSSGGDYSESISQYVADLVVKGEITGEQENDLTEIMQARFNERGATGLWQDYKNFSYMDTMGSPVSALTQIGDQAFSAYEAGVIPALKNAVKAFVGKSRITKEDVGIERMAEEFADSSRLANAVNTVFKVVGLNKMDSIGKESLLNSSLEKYEKRAKKDPGALAKDIKRVFGDETQSVIEDLQNGEITDNVKYLVYSRLLDFQPAALSEMPQKYLTAGNGRIFYMLKTYTLKQFDIYRREAFQKIRSGNMAEKREGVKNMARLSMMLVLANATADEAKDFILGRETDFEDRVVDNLLRLAGASKYITWQARTEGVPTALAKQILPPFKFLDSLTRDIVTAGDDKGLQTLGSVPVVGKLADWHMGRSSHKRSDLWQRRLSKQKAKLADIKDEVERNPKMAKSYKKELRRLRKINKFQSKMNRLKSQINRAIAEGNNDKAKRIDRKRVRLIKAFLKTL